MVREVSMSSVPTSLVPATETVDRHRGVTNVSGLGDLGFGSKNFLRCFGIVFSCVFFSALFYFIFLNILRTEPYSFLYCACAELGCTYVRYLLFQSVRYLLFQSNTDGRIKISKSNIKNFDKANENAKVAR